MKFKSGFVFILLFAAMIVFACSSSENKTTENPGATEKAQASNASFAVNDLDGNVRNYEEFKGKGPLVLNFWGTWCPPCRRELPDLKKIYHEYKDQGLQMVGLAVHDKPADVSKFAKDHELDWVMLISNDNAAQSFRIGTGVPVTIFIDKDGNEVTRMIGARDYATFKEAVEKII